MNDPIPATDLPIGDAAWQPGTPPTMPQPPAPDAPKHQRAVAAMARRATALPDTSLLMLDAASLLAEILDVEQSLVAEPAPDGQSLRGRLTLHAAPDDDSPTSACESVPSGNGSLAGYALRAARPVVVEDLAREKRFADPFLHDRRVCSALAVPLSTPDRAYGVLAACSSRPRRFADEELLFAETIAHLVAVTVARAETEKSAAELRRHADAVLQTVDALVLTLDVRWRVQDINAATERVTGFRLEDVKNRALWDVFPVPDETSLLQDLTTKFRDGTSAAGYEFDLLTKDSHRRLINWSYRPVADEEGTPTAILATGIDVTERHEAERKAARAERNAEKVNLALARIQAEQGQLSAGKAEHRRQEVAIRPFARTPIPSGAERRQQPRRAYPYRQWVAPMAAGRLPRLHEFTEILCHDIAAGGFSFLAPERPASEMVVVGLGIPPKITYLLAQVTHVTQVSDNGPHQFLIGCCYVGRADY